MASRAKETYLRPHISAFDIFESRSASHTMSENSAVSPHPQLGPTSSRPLPLESQVESSAKSQDRYAPAPRQTRGSREEEERRGGEPEEVRRLRRDVGGLKGQLEREKRNWRRRASAGKIKSRNRTRRSIRCVASIKGLWKNRRGRWKSG